MNLRIQALADQAEDYADSIVDQGGEFHLAYTQKLSELVVQECVNVLHDNELHNRHISHVLREHFGVE